jgi:anti-sigma-K factor RskA
MPLDRLGNANILIINLNQRSIWRRKMLGAIAAVALVVGGISAGFSVSQDDQQALSQPREAVIEVQVSNADQVQGN